MIAFDSLQIGYQEELQENVLPEDIRREHENDILLWAVGSGRSPAGPEGRYFCCLDWKGTLKYFEGEVPGAGSANAAMAEGVIAAANAIKKPGNVCLIAIAPLGIKNAFKEKGPNARQLAKFFRILQEKGCTLTEIQYPGGAEEIKRLVFAADPAGQAVHRLEKEKANAQKGVADYKEKVYAECLAKVEKILTEESIPEEIIRRVREIRP